MTTERTATYSVDLTVPLVRLPFFAQPQPDTLESQPDTVESQADTVASVSHTGRTCPGRRSTTSCVIRHTFVKSHMTSGRR